MRRLTLIRHALTDWNASGRFQGQTDRPLSREGQAQARELGRHVARSPEPERVYASPLSRALETARIAFPTVEVITDARLMELDFGDFEGSTLAENERHASWAQWYADPFGRRTPGGESYRDLRERAVAWMESLPEEPHIVAVTHSGTIQMLVTHVLGVEHPRWRKRIFLDHTGITRLLFRNGEALVERVNDTRHLRRNGADPFLD